MADLKVCRICLCKGVKIYNYDQYYLKQYYEEILGSKVNYKDGLPHHFCYVCAAMLQKFHKFKERCHTGQKTLKELLWNGPLTLTSISQMARSSKNFKSPLGIIRLCKRVKTYTVKSESLSKSHATKKPNYSHISLDDKNLAELKAEMIVIENEYTDSENVAIEIDRLNNDKSSNDQLLSDVEADGILTDGDSVSSEEERNDGEIFQLKNLRSQIKLTVEEKEESVTKEVSSHKMDCADDKKEIHDTENVSDDDMQKEIKEENKGSVEEKRKFASRTKRLFLDPNHWLTVTLSEIEAETEFRARAHDPKYLSAPYKCVDCFKGFSKEDILTRHIKLRHCQSLGPVECRFCKMRFRRKCLLNRHAKQHYSRFKCLRCDLTCPIENSAFSHNEYHNGVIRKCSHCGEEFRHSSTYYTHMRTHRSEHVCTLCGASFVSKMGLQQHTKIKHIITEIKPGEEVNTFCQRCDIRFETRKAFEEHLSHSALHAEDVEDLESGTQPGKKPASRKATRPFKSYRNPRKLTPCTICNRNFPSGVAYIRHHMAEHKDEPLPKDRHICEICGASLAPGSVASHMLVHTRARPFACGTCGLQLRDKSTMTRHLRTHTGEKPFECSLCEKRFTQSNSMKLHYRTFHLKEPYPKRNRNKKSVDQQELSVLEDYYRNDEVEKTQKLNRWR